MFNDLADFGSDLLELFYNQSGPIQFGVLATLAVFVLAAGYGIYHADLKYKESLRAHLAAKAQPARCPEKRPHRHFVTNPAGFGSRMACQGDRREHDTVIVPDEKAADDDRYVVNMGKSKYLADPSLSRLDYLDGVGARNFKKYAKAGE